MYIVRFGKGGGGVVSACVVEWFSKVWFGSVWFVSGLGCVIWESVTRGEIFIVIIYFLTILTIYFSKTITPISEVKIFEAVFKT